MDITKCKGDNCPLKENCLRFKGPSSYYQSYFMNVPYKDKDCKELIKMEHKYPRLRKKILKLTESLNPSILVIVNSKHGIIKFKLVADFDTNSLPMRIRVIQDLLKKDEKFYWKYMFNMDLYTKEEWEKK